MQSLSARTNGHNYTVCVCVEAETHVFSIVQFGWIDLLKDSELTLDAGYSAVMDRLSGGVLL
jgi:hypothetical protein